MPAKLTLQQEVLKVLGNCPQGLSRDDLYRCGQLSAHEPAALLLALNDLVAERLIASRDPGEIGSPYQITPKGTRRLLVESPPAVYAHTGGSVAREAHQIVRERGAALPRFELVAQLWNAMPARPFTAERVAIFMELFKLAGEDLEPGRDHRIDIAGYAEVIDRIHRERAERAQQSAEPIPA